MNVAGGVHPYVLRRRRNALSRSGPSGRGLVPSLALALLFLAGFATGLRWIDHRFAPTPVRSAPAPAREPGFSFPERLSESVRFALGIPTVHAAEFDSARFKAQPEKRTVSVTAAPGGTATVEIRVKNVGSSAWSPEGKGFVSMYTTQPRYHPGVLRHTSWLSSSQPAKISSKVAPGETGIVSFTVQAPQKEGTYSDWMQLAVEDTSWVYGGHVQVSLTVKKGAAPVPPVTSPAPTTPTTPTPTPSSGAVLLLKSSQKITSAGNGDIAFTAGFKNAGSVAWNDVSLKLKDGSVAYPSWTSADVAARVAGPVAPGALAFVSFTMSAPKVRGEHVARFTLVADGREFPESPLEIPISVTSDWQAPSAPNPSPSVPSSEIPWLGGSEPLIRVGLYYTEVEREEFTADVPYDVRDLAGATLGSFQAGASVQAWYDAASGLYRLTDGVREMTGSGGLRFVPSTPEGIVTALAHVDRPAWNLSLNDNRFRGVIEFRRHSSGRVWAINELPMERYLWGLAESSNAEPMEFMKALAVAARSYGYWHLTHPGKYDHFTVGALNDQVYKGYGAELRYPNFKAAAEATRGQVVHYGGDHVITPYFTWSDGRTRSWTEVWGGAEKPWLVSVPTPSDAGRQLFGHGVGMSAWDAIARAKAGEGYVALLRHYYVGTGLKRPY